MYYAGPFYAVAEAFSLQYTSIVAHPDHQAYMYCLKLLEKQEKVNKTFVEAAKKVWKKGLEMKRMNGKEKDGVPNWPLPDGFYLRYCVRDQQLLINLSEIRVHIAKGIKSCIERRCYFQSR